MAQKLLFYVLFSILFSFAFVACQITNIECNQSNQGRHYPSGVNCSTFYTCFNRNFHLQSCPYPFWFSNSMQACVVQEMSDCVLGPDNEVCNTANHGRHFPTQFNCTSYFTCFSGVFYLQNCPNGFFFIFEQQSCMYLTEFDCQIPPDQNTPPPPPTTTTEVTTTTIPIPTECPASGVSKIPNAYSCTNYFLCFAGTKIPQSCSSGLHFSRSQLKCVRPEQSDCVLPTTCPQSGNDPLNVVFLPDKTDCQKYFICINGNPQSFSCAATLHWDPNTNKCIPQEDSQCEPEIVLPDIREIDCPETSLNRLEFVAHPVNCEFYFICHKNRSHLARCAQNLHFDHVMGECFFKEVARCISGSN